MFTRVHPGYCHEPSWHQVCQILAWCHFTHVHHDIDHPIGVYLDSIIVTAAQSGETLDAVFKLIEANAAAYEEGKL
ncbi:hypothetical protein EV359DRAFT_87534 [Lentinula novae-zelandiae]|nr:hypothetical protein EV359DRAFT_87534 [Lentinula novae-zelandiae]